MSAGHGAAAELMVIIDRGATETGMDYTALAGQLVKTCLARGADAAEVYIESGRQLSIAVRKGDVETIEEAATAGVGFRVFVKGRMAFSSCNDLKDAALDNALARAIEFAASTTPDPNNVLPADTGMATVEGLYDSGIAKVSMERKIELAKALEKLAMKDPRITKSEGANYGEGESEIFLANSNGLSKSYRASGCSIGVSVVAEKGADKNTGGEYCSRRHFADLVPNETLAGKAVRSACELLGAKMVKTQRAAVIVDPDVAGSIFGGVLRAIDGESVLQGASFLGASLNKTIASNLLTLIDDGTRARGMESAPFDGEGVPTQKRILVDKGVLLGFLYNTAVAKRAGVRSTGNASRGGFNRLPGIGAHNFYMAAGTTPVEDIIKATRTGLLLKDVTGYGINPVNGNFSGGASGLWIEDGKVAFPVKGLTIASTAAEILNGIDLVAGDLDLNRRFAAPTFRIREMQIGGE
jgi:PmbA protein